MQQELHRDINYGVASLKFAPLVAHLIKTVGAKELLDYGAGKGRLAFALDEILAEPLKIYHYEPAIPEWSQSPAPCALVTCIDVLEHIEPALLDNVLDDLQRLTESFGFFTVHTGPAGKVLPDGRNAHLTQQPASWWMPKFLDRFDLATFNRISFGFYVIVARKGT